MAKNFLGLRGLLDVVRTCVRHVGWSCLSAIRRGRRVVTSALLSVIMLSAAMAATESNESKPPSQFEILGVEFHKKSEYDSGSIRILLKNTGSKPVGDIAECRVEGLVSDESPDKSKEIPCLYARLTPPQLRVGEIGELLVKPNGPLSPFEKLRCRFKLSDDSEYSTLVSARNPPLQIVSVSFAPDPGRIYVYVRNLSDDIVEVTHVAIGELIVEENLESINNPIAPGEKACLVANTKLNFTDGEYVWVTVIG